MIILKQIITESFQQINESYNYVISNVKSLPKYVDNNDPKVVDGILLAYTGAIVDYCKSLNILVSQKIERLSIGYDNVFSSLNTDAFETKKGYISNPIRIRLKNDTYLQIRLYYEGIRCSIVDSKDAIGSVHGTELLKTFTAYSSLKSILPNVVMLFLENTVLLSWKNNDNILIDALKRVKLKNDDFDISYNIVNNINIAYRQMYVRDNILGTDVDVLAALHRFNIELKPTYTNNITYNNLTVRLLTNIDINGRLQLQLHCRAHIQKYLRHIYLYDTLKYDTTNAKYASELSKKFISMFESMYAIICKQSIDIPLKYSVFSESQLRGGFETNSQDVVSYIAKASKYNKNIKVAKINKKADSINYDDSLKLPNANEFIEQFLDVINSNIRRNNYRTSVLTMLYKLRPYAMTDVKKSETIFAANVSCIEERETTKDTTAVIYAVKDSTDRVYVVLKAPVDTTHVYIYKRLTTVEKTGKIDWDAFNNIVESMLYVWIRAQFYDEGFDHRISKKVIDSGQLKISNKNKW